MNQATLDPATPPPCPITGAPGSVLVEDISPKFLVDLWRRGAGVDPAPLSPASPRIGLWRSPAGLYFFHPAAAGSERFYRDFYARVDAYDIFARHAEARVDLQAGVAVIRPGDRVLDVGCGDGAFARLVPGADYTGLDLHHVPPPGGPRVLNEDLAGHADRCPEAYDVVCGFQVIEHVADPLALARDMVRCLRPGGLLVLAMPLFDSPFVETPNVLLNLPPHHLSLWTPEAAAALARALGLEPVRIEPLAPNWSNGMQAWYVKLVPGFLRPGRFVRPGILGLWCLAVAYVLARRIGVRFGLPKGTRAFDLAMVARKPGS